MIPIEKRFAGQLGLATNPFFKGLDEKHEERHVAMLDGVAASFALSVNFDSTSRDNEIANWAWSSLLRHHVTIFNDKVEVRSASARVSKETFSLQSVERNPEGFLRYLEKKVEQPKIDVAEHIISVFRKHCQWLQGREEKPSALFLSLLAVGLENGLSHVPDAKDLIVPLKGKYGLADASLEAATTADKDYLNRLAEELSFCLIEARQLDLELAVRHANGPLFQDAHAMMSALPRQQTLFGLGDAPSVTSFGRGSFFTPQGLARSMADYVLSKFEGSGDKIVVADVACGSGVFLGEALRALARNRFTGTVKLVGVDISPDAIAMARFNVACVARDIESDHFKIELDLRCGNLFDQQLDWSEISSVLMNPPFLSWEMMTDEEKAQLKSVVGANYKGRMDYATAFLTHVVKNLKPSAWVASLLPGGVIFGQHGEAWRRSLTQDAQLSLVAALGDHNLFRGAMVSPAIAILQKSPAESSPVTLLWSSQKKDAASAGLRELRKVARSPSIPVVRSDDWSLYPVEQEEFKARTNWLPSPSAIGALLGDLRRGTPTTVSDFFKIVQGVRTGLKDAFILSNEVWASLPEPEQKHFRQVADSRDFHAGQLFPGSYIFWPQEAGETVEQIQAITPTYFDQVFSQHIDQLSRRAGVSAETPGRLTRARTELPHGTPRIISKMFARSFGFATDLEGKYVVVQGLSWMPKPKLLKSFGDDEQSIKEGLRLYAALLNSEVFYKLIQNFSTNVAGGQLDLAAKFLNGVPLPNLGERLEESDELNQMAKKLLRLEPSDMDYQYTSLINAFAALAYKTTLSQWINEQTL